MRALTTLENLRRQALFDHGFEVALFEPTNTGLEKDLYDATDSFRDVLASNGIHDYETQAFGGRVQMGVNFIRPDRLPSSTAAFYRSKTRGDRRMRFTNLRSYAAAGDILGLFKSGNRLYLINFTRIDVLALLIDVSSNPIRELIISSTGINEVSPDIDSIIYNSKLQETEKLTEIRARLGQGIFRTKLINFWTGSCCVTGYRDPRILRASHIKPWRVSTNPERLDVFNGLLLIPNLDSAFDSGLITFELTGQIRISPQLVRPQALGIVPNMQARLENGHSKYIRFHQQQIYRI